MPWFRNVTTFLIGAALVAGTWAAPALAQDKLKVVASFSILADLARNVGGERVEVATLVGPGGDAHVFQPTPADARKLGEAKVVVVNGLKLEGWFGRLVKSSGAKAAIVEASRGVKALRSEESPGHDHGHDHGHGGLDPHAWQDVRNAKIYVANIRDAFVKADPAGQGTYEVNAKAYTEALDALDAEIRAAVARIPAERRKVITSHDAFRYFEAAYGLDFIAPQGVSTETEASAKAVGRIIQQIKREKVPAVFVETITDQRLIERIAKETGAKIGETVYSDALSGAEGPAGTYIDMMRHNIRAFSAALSS
ncbi:MAG TPA: metal ABC transporter substrate-binding protein [Beijerinckiaceae bacterium]|jgi:zinc/manganese transport system substrate-binding protein